MKDFLEEIATEIVRDIENLKDNNEVEYLNELNEDTTLVEERVEGIISNLEEENEVKFDGNIAELVDYYIDRLSVYID